MRTRHNKDRYSAYLEVSVSDDTPQPDVKEIIDALSKISSFFGTRLVTGNGGGSPSQRVLLPLKPSVTNVNHAPPRQEGA